MKIFIMFFVSFSCLVDVISARSESTSMMVTLRQIQIAIGTHLSINNGILPSTLEDIAELNLMVQKKLILVDRINRLAIVPSAPMIQPEIGLSRDYTDRRIFAIYRVANFDNTLRNDDKSELGRFAIFINQDAIPDPPRWIPESQAQLILKQLKDFDPAKQPLAFQDVDIPRLDKSKLSLDISSIPVSPNSSKPEKDIKVDQAPSNTPTTLPLWPWIVGIILTLIAGIYYIKRITNQKSD